MSIRLSLLVVILFSGCAVLREIDSKDKEQVLIAAGFKIMLADTPQEKASLAARTPYKIEKHMLKKGPVYTYADPRRSRLLIGGPEEYAAYKKLRGQEDAAMQEESLLSSPEMNPMSTSEWSAWLSGGNDVVNELPYLQPF